MHPPYTRHCFPPSPECQRFLRATKWDLGAAISRTEETLSWRREFGVDAINDDPSIVEEEAKTGKEVVLGWDVQKRPCLYMFPWRQNVRTGERYTLMPRLRLRLRPSNRSVDIPHSL